MWNEAPEDFRASSLKGYRHCCTRLWSSLVMGAGMRLVAAALVGLVFWGFAAGASAQNGLQRFESDIKPQLEVKKFTYGSASALGSAGFVLNDVVAVIPGNPATGDKDSTIKIDKVTVDELDFDRLKKGASDDELPRFAKLKIEGMTGDDTDRKSVV